MRRFVWSRNLMNEEALTRVGPQRHRKKIYIAITVSLPIPSFVERIAWRKQMMAVLVNGLQVPSYTLT